MPGLTRLKPDGNLRVAFSLVTAFGPYSAIVATLKPGASFPFFSLGAVFHSTQAEDDRHSSESSEVQPAKSKRGWEEGDGTDNIVIKRLNCRKSVVNCHDIL